VSGFHEPGDHPADVANNLERVAAFLCAAVSSKRKIEVLDDLSLDGLAMILFACQCSLRYISEQAVPASRAV